MTQSIIHELNSYKEAVVYIYKNWPETIQSDDVLVAKYEELTGLTLPANKVNTVCRAARKIRQHDKQNANIFQRTAEVTQKTQQLQEDYIKWNGEDEI